MLYDAVIYDNEGIDMPGVDRQIVRNRLRSLIVVGCTGSPAYVALFQEIRTFVMVPDIDIIRAAQATITRPFARVAMAVRVARRQDHWTKLRPVLLCLWPVSNAVCQPDATATSAVEHYVLIVIRKGGARVPLAALFLSSLGEIVFVLERI